MRIRQFTRVGIGIIASLLGGPSGVAASLLDDAAARLKNSGTGAGFNTTGQPQTQFLEIVGAIVQGMLALLGAFFFIYIVYAGITWATAGGNTERVDKARSILKNNIIGLIITLFAGALVTYVMAAITSAAG